MRWIRPARTNARRSKGASTIRDATTEETLELIKREQLQDLGCGAVDLSLLASVLLTPDTMMWTLDKNLDAVATRLGVAFPTKSMLP